MQPFAFLASTPSARSAPVSPMPRLRAAVCLSAVALLLAAAPVSLSAVPAEPDIAAEIEVAEKPGEVRDIFDDAIDVELVTVPFYVVDAEGDPIYDLEGSEVELWMDGEKMELDFFDRHGSVAETVLTGEATEESTTAVAEELLPLGTPRHVFFLFDMAFSVPRGVHAAKRTAELLLGEMPDKDWLYMLTYHTQSGFEQQVGPVAADEEGRRRMREEMARLRPNMERIQLHADVQPIARGKREGGNVDAAYWDMHRIEKGNYRAEAYALADSLDYFATFLRQVEGPKLVLYFSQGINSDLFMNGNERGQPIHRRFDPVMQALGESGAMPVFINSLTHTDAGLDETTEFTLEADANFVNEFGGTVGEAALVRMAEISGGKVIQHTNVKTLANRISDWTAAHYEVGYYPRDGRSPDPSVRPEIRVLREGAEVWSPKHVKARRRFEELSPREKQFVIADLVLRGPQGQAARQVGGARFYRLDGSFDGNLSAENRDLSFQARWPEELRFKALELYSVVLEPGDKLLEGRLLQFNGNLFSPSTPSTTVNVSVPADGELVWGIVAVEPISKALYVRRMMLRPEQGAVPARLEAGQGR